MSTKCDNAGKVLGTGPGTQENGSSDQYIICGILQLLLASYFKYCAQYEHILLCPEHCRPEGRCRERDPFGCSFQVWRLSSQMPPTPALCSPFMSGFFLPLFQFHKLDSPITFTLSRNWFKLLFLWCLALVSFTGVRFYIFFIPSILF